MSDVIMLKWKEQKFGLVRGGWQSCNAAGRPRHLKIKAKMVMGGCVFEMHRHKSGPSQLKAHSPPWENHYKPLTHTWKFTLSVCQHCTAFLEQLKLEQRQRSPRRYSARSVSAAFFFFFLNEMLIAAMQMINWCVYVAIFWSTDHSKRFYNICHIHTVSTGCHARCHLLIRGDIQPAH